MLEPITSSLETPVLKDADSVFPGENWFFYWKTSSSLWKKKLETGTGSVIIPIYWAFHSETGEDYDFAKIRPETNFKKLVEITRDSDREPTFLLPLGPCPFLPNGGIPPFLAQVLSLDNEQQPRVFANNEGQLNRLCSLFDNRIFKHFSYFVTNLGQYFSREGIDSALLGLEPGYVNHQGFHPYLIDYSSAFYETFGRFKKTKEARGEENINPAAFIKAIYLLYKEEAQNALAGNWEGTRRIAFLGGTPQNFYAKLSCGDDLQECFNQMSKALSLGVTPSSVLLSPAFKKGILQRALGDLAIPDSAKGALEESSGCFKHLSFFEIFNGPAWKALGLWEVLKKYAYGSFFEHLDQFSWDENLDVQNKIFFFQGNSVNEELFSDLLKLFMNGGKIILDHSELASDYQKKLELFFLENSIKAERINFHGVVENRVLGEGRLLIFEGKTIQGQSERDRYSFWMELFKTFPLKRLNLPPVEGLHIYWKTRPTRATELSYEEVRRLYLYNPTSYKKRMKIAIRKGICLLKIIDELHTHIKVQPHELNIELLPQGSVALDFGLFS